MSVMDDLKRCCDGLTSRHVTERRKCAEQMLDLLSNAAVCELLNAGGASGGRTNGGIGWQFVFDRTASFLQLQLTKIEDDTRCGRGLTSKLKSAQDSMRVVRRVVCTANQLGQVRLCMSTVLNHLVAIVRHDFRRDVCGAEVCALIRDAFLINDAAVMSLDRCTWLQLLQVTRRCVRNPPARISLDSLYSMLTLCVRRGREQTVLSPAIYSLLPLGRNIAKDNAVSCSIAVQFVSIVLAEVGPCSRDTAVDLCEHLLIVVVRRACDRCMQHVVEFLQSALHYACVGRSQLSDTWLSHCAKLYQFFSDLFDGSAHQQARVEWRSGGVLQQRIVAVCCQVVSVLFSDARADVVFSQLATRDVLSQARKRVRVDIGVCFIVERITSCGDQYFGIAWLQLLISLLRNHCELFDMSLLTSCADVVQRELNKCTVDTLNKQYLRLAAVLIDVNPLRSPSSSPFSNPLTADPYIPATVATSARTHLNNSTASLPADHTCSLTFNASVTPPQWCCSVWRSSLKHLSSTVCEEEAHFLLQRLMITGCAVPSESLLDHFVHASFKSSPISLATLLVYLKTHNQPLPNSDDIRDSSDTRAQLVKWALSIVPCDFQHCAVLAEILTRLVVIDTTANNISLLSTDVAKIQRTPSTQAHVNLFYSEEHLTPSCGQFRLSGVSCLQSFVVNCIIELFSKVTDNATQCFHLLASVKMLQLWVKGELVGKRYIHSSNIVPCISAVFACLINSLISSIRLNHVEASVLSSLTFIEDVVNIIIDLLASYDKHQHALAEVLLSSLPTDALQSLVASLEDYTCCLWLDKNSVSNKGPSLFGEESSLSDDLVLLVDRASNHDTMLSDCSGSVVAIKCRLTRYLNHLDASVCDSLCLLTHQSQELRIRVFSLVMSFLTLDFNVIECRTLSGDLQGSLLSRVLSASPLNASDAVDAVICVGLVASASEVPLFGTASCLVSCFEVLWRLCCEFMNDCRLSCQLMCVLRTSFASSVAPLRQLDHWNVLLNLYSGLKGVVCAGRGGIACVVEFLRLTASLCCLGVRHDITLDQAGWIGCGLVDHLSCNQSSSDEDDQNQKTLIGTHITRMEACRLLAQIFAEHESMSADCLVDVPAVDDIFTEVAHRCESGVVAARKAVDSSCLPPDELFCRVVELLSCMFGIFVSCGQCRSRALFTIIDSVNSVDAYVDLAREKLKSISETLGLVTEACLLRKYYRIFLLWQDKYSSLTNIPFKLFGFASVDAFIETFWHELIPCAMLTDSCDYFDSIRNVVQQSPQQLIISSIPQILSHIMFDLLVGFEAAGNIRSHRLFQLALRMVNDAAMLNESLKRHSHSAVLMFFRVHGASPHAQAAIFSMCRDLYGLDPVLSLQNPSSYIPQVLCQLASDVVASLDPIDKQDCVVKFCAFVSCLVKFFASLGDCSAFTVRFTVQFIVKQLSDSLVLRCRSLLIVYLKCLRKFLGQCGCSCPQLLVRSVHDVCSCLDAIRQRICDQKLLDEVESLQTLVLHELSVGNADIGLQADIFLGRDRPALNTDNEANSSAGDVSGLLSRFLSADDHGETISLGLLERFYALLDGRGGETALSDQYLARLVVKLVSLLPSISAECRPAVGRLLAHIGPLSAIDQELVGSTGISAKEATENELTRQLRLLKLVRSQLWQHANPAVSLAAQDALRSMLVAWNGDKQVLKKLQRQDDVEYQLLLPFYASTPVLDCDTISAECVTSPSEDQLVDSLDTAELWTLRDGISGENEWLRGLASALLTTASVERPFLSSFERLIELVDIQVIDRLLPDLVELSVRACPSLSRVLARRFTGLLRYFSSDSNCADTPPGIHSVRVVLSVLAHLRRQPMPSSLLRGGRDCVWRRCFWLPVCLATAARAALHVSALYDAVLLAELWMLQHTSDASTSAVPSNAHDIDNTDSREVNEFSPSTITPDNSDRVLLVLTHVYERLNDVEGLMSLQDGRGSHQLSLRLLEKRDPAAALSVHDVNMDSTASQNNERAYSGLLHCQRQLRMFNSVRLCVKHQAAEMEAHSAHEQDLWHEACWRLADWKCAPVTAVSSAGRASVHYTLHASLSAMWAGDQRRAVQAIDCGVSRVLEDLTASVGSVGLAQLNTINDRLLQLHLLATARQLCNCLRGDQECSSSVADMCAAWTVGLSDDANISAMPVHYPQREPVLALRAVCLSLASRLGPSTLSSQCSTGRDQLLCQLATEARSAGDVATALRATAQLAANSLTAQQQTARNCWLAGQKRQALHIYQRLLDTPADSGDNDAGKLGRIRLRCEYAGWLLETHSANARDIVDQHLLPAATMLTQLTPGIADSNILTDAHYLVGQYVDAQFSRVDRYVNSPECDKKRRNAAAMLREAQLLQASCDRSTARNERQRALVKKMNNFEQMSLLDETCVRQCLVERRQYLELALTSYLHCLRVGRRHDFLVYRVVALWLSEREGQVSHLLAANVDQVPCHKWLPLLQQLAARLGRRVTSSNSSKTSDNSGEAATSTHAHRALFCRTLQRIVKACTVKHPHHGLPVLLALIHALYDGVSGAGDSATEARISAASSVVDCITHTSPDLAEHVTQLSGLCKALIDLSSYQPAAGANKYLRVPSSCGLTGLTQLSRVAVPTDYIPIQIDGEYRSVATVESWGSNFTTLIGVNVPKKLTCLASDGKTRCVLLKGRDDLRQDAVMQQVFGVVNQLLEQCRDEGQRLHCLRMRTYKVVPLSQRSGVIEWCANTTPMFTYLSRAHAFYRPGDMKITDARNLMSQTAHESPAERLNVYLNICQRLKPVFRHFILERCVQSREWHTRRCRYSRSVAVASMAGYILGLGDRHANNLLLDEQSGELINIDFGLAFDGGLLLNTPETVPFRLTRDVVDGMGCCGVEGWFRAAAEHTLTVLRKHSHVVLTIVRVILDDPLYIWTLTPEKVSRVQHSERTVLNEDPVHQHADNKMAERVMSRLAEKLRGHEMGQVMTCADQVNYLIQEATDVNNLCRLFHGWQPYL